MKDAQNADAGCADHDAYNFVSILRMLQYSNIRSNTRILEYSDRYANIRVL